MTYDSDAFIQLISPTLGKVVPGGNVLAFAEEHFAAPLGMPGLFAGDAYVGGGNISAGGGQQMTCRQIARVGQLLANRGRWRGGGGGGDGSNGTITVYSAEYAEAMTTQSFPHWGSNYGFLTWTNARGTAPSFCCAPRWCQARYDSAFKGPSDTQMNGIVGSDIFLGRDPSSPGYDAAHPGHPRTGPLISAYGTFRLNFHRFDRFELDLRGYTPP